VGCCGGRYLLIRGLLPAAAVQDARVAALAELAELRPDKFAAGVPPQQGLAAPGATNLGLLGERERERERERVDLGGLTREVERALALKQPT
jgi:hypothetical protein